MNVRCSREQKGLLVPGEKASHTHWSLSTSSHVVFIGGREMRSNASYMYNCQAELLGFKFVMVACILSWDGQSSAATREDVGRCRQTKYIIVTGPRESEYQ